MTKRAITALLLLLSCVPPCMAAQAPRQSSAAEATVRALDDQERLAALNRDYAALERLWSEHFIVNTATNQILPNRRAALDHFRRGMTTRSSFERSIEQVRIDGDIAIVMGLETLTPTGSAPLAGQTVRRRFTNIWKKEGDTWRLWARHANVIPAPTSEEQLVRSLDDQERRAALARDVAALERLWSPDLTVNAPNSQLLVGRDSTMKLVQQGVINFSSFERDVEFVRILDDIAIVMGSETVQLIPNAQTNERQEAQPFGLQAGQTVRRRFTNIWRKEAGTWRLYARHANVILSR